MRKTEVGVEDNDETSLAPPRDQRKQNRVTKDPPEPGAPYMYIVPSLRRKPNKQPQVEDALYHVFGIETQKV